jgi:hypothetical protein
VWTWNAIGKAPGAWNLTADADESRRGFLLNALITDELPASGDNPRVSNSDPITGQAGWYDVRVQIAKAGDDAVALPAKLLPYPGMETRPYALAYRAATVKK